MKQTKHIIDCDADPFVPEGWQVIEHIKSGQLEWNPNAVSLYLTPHQRQYAPAIKGSELRKKLATMRIVNANVLDYLVAHPELILEEWKNDTYGIPESRVSWWGGF